MKFPQNNSYRIMISGRLNMLMLMKNLLDWYERSFLTKQFLKKLIENKCSSERNSQKHIPSLLWKLDYDYA